jgi:hypothetical protein
MRLQRAEIRNFRSIENVDIVFEPRCRVLVGINESGKSNILRALSFLDPEAKVESGDLRELRSNEKPYKAAYLRFHFGLSEDDKLKALKSFKQKVAGDVVKEPIICIAKSKYSIADFINSRSVTLYEINLIDGTRRFLYFALPSDSEVIGNWRLRNTDPPLGGQASSVDPRVIHHVKSRLVSSELNEFKPEDLNNLVGAEFNALLKDSMPDVVFWEYDEDQLLPGKIQTAEFSSAPDSCVPLRNMFELAGIDEDEIETTIDAALERSKGMRNLLRRVSAAATRHLHRVWREYRDVKLELVENGDFIDAHVLDRHNTYDLAQRSDGFKRFVSFLLDISVRARAQTLSNTLYLDDEPDIGLHPSGARYLRDELVRVATDNYVVYATHSIFMIDRDYLPRHLIVSKQNEATRVEDAGETNFSSEEVLFNAMGYSIFEQLSATNIVFEGWRDKRLCEVALSDTRSRSKSMITGFENVGRCYANGLKDVGRITAMLELARRDCVILTDNDGPAREHQKSYRGYGRWLRYDQILPSCKAITGEDFISSVVLLSALKEIRADDPRLSSPTSLDLQKVGRLKTISGWFARAGIEAEEIKTKLQRVKRKIFADLSPDQVEPAYYDLLQELLQRTRRRKAN